MGALLVLVAGETLLPLRLAAENDHADADYQEHLFPPLLLQLLPWLQLQLCSISTAAWPSTTTPTTTSSWPYCSSPPAPASTCGATSCCIIIPTIPTAFG